MGIAYVDSEKYRPKDRTLRDAVIAVLQGQISHHLQPHIATSRKGKISSTEELYRPFPQILPASAAVLHDPGYQTLRRCLGGPGILHRAMMIVYCWQKVVLYFDQCRLRAVVAAKMLTGAVRRDRVSSHVWLVVLLQSSLGPSPDWPDWTRARSDSVCLDPRRISSRVV